MTIRSILAAVAIAVGACAAPSLAHASALEHFMETWDLDGDGRITLEEIRQERGRLLQSFDSNGDGTLDQAEYAEFDTSRAAGVGSAPPEERVKMKRIAEGMSLVRNDGDGDGRVSRTEFIAAG